MEITTVENINLSSWSPHPRPAKDQFTCTLQKSQSCHSRGTRAFLYQKLTTEKVTTCALNSTHRQFKASIPCHALNQLGQVKAGAPVKSQHSLPVWRETGHGPQFQQGSARAGSFQCSWSAGWSSRPARRAGCAARGCRWCTGTPSSPRNLQRTEWRGESKPWFPSLSALQHVQHSPRNTLQNTLQRICPGQGGEESLFSLLCVCNCLCVQLSKKPVQDQVQKSQNAGSLLYQPYTMYSILQGTCCRTRWRRESNQRFSSLFCMYTTLQGTCLGQKRQNTGSLLFLSLALQNVQDSTRNLPRIKWRWESKQVLFSISTTQCTGLYKEPSQDQVETRVKTSSLFH